MSPMLKRVERAGLAGIKRKRNPFLISAEDFFTETEVLRKEYAKLIRVNEPKRIVVIPSASYGLSTVAKNVKVGAGDSILVLHEQFPSNMYPWRRVAEQSGARLDVVEPPDTFKDRGKEWNVRLLEAIKKETKLIAMGHVHWADGTKFDLEAVGRRAREVGARLVIDGTQSIGALPFDVSKVKPDALICAGYKWLMGPYSIGMGYFGDSFDNGVPLEENWINRSGSENFAGLIKYEDSYQPGSLRYEVGEHSNFILVPMMLEALRQINAWTPAAIQAYCKSISKDAINALRENGNWVEQDEFRAHHLFGIRFPKGTDVSMIKERIRRKRISVSFRGESVRVSPNVYNTATEMNQLARVIGDIRQ